jgi:hypothetical protein
MEYGFVDHVYSCAALAGGRRASDDNPVTGDK